MTRRNLKVTMSGLVMAMVAALVVTTATMAAGGPQGAGRQQDLAAIGGDLDAEEQAALVEFYLDEHKALATYESVMADLGTVQPFVSIARAEEQHIAALEAVFSRYGVALPTVPDFDVPSFATAEDACVAGAQAEIDNAALYDRLLSAIDNADVIRVAENLRDASMNNHLTAFEACADGETNLRGVGGAVAESQARNQAGGRWQDSGNTTGRVPLGRAASRSEARGNRGQGVARSMSAACEGQPTGEGRGR